MTPDAEKRIRGKKNSLLRLYGSQHENYK